MTSQHLEDLHVWSDSWVESRKTEEVQTRPVSLNSAWKEMLEKFWKLIFLKKILLGKLDWSYIQKWLNKPDKIKRAGPLFCSTEPFKRRCAGFCAPLFLAGMNSGVWKKGVKLNIYPTTETAEGPPLCCSFPLPCRALRLQTLMRGEPLQPAQQAEQPCVKRAVFAPDISRFTTGLYSNLYAWSSCDLQLHLESPQAFLTL